MGKTNNYCFLNNKFVKEKEAKISVNDIGLHRGYGVFEVLRTYLGKPFLLDEHLDRLYSSAKELNLKIPYSKDKITKILFTLLKRNKFPESLVKIIVTGGESDDGTKPGEKPTFIVLNKLLPTPKTEIYKMGVKLITLKYQRFLPLAKTLNYIELIKNQKRLERERAFTLLYTYNGQVLEGAICNVFMFKENKLITPRSGVLNGITRDLVLKIARKSFRIEKRRVLLKELLNSDEVFVTLTTKGIVPVVQIDDRKIGNGKPGEKTKHLMQLFNQFV